MNKFLPVVATVVVACAAGGWWYAKQQAPNAPHQHRLVRQTTPEGKVYYTCPMHPQVHQDAPGQCPICGMKLVERQEPADPAAAAAAEAPKPLYWYDPMLPEQHFEHPGKSTMGMEMVPKYAGPAVQGRSGTIVSIDPRMAQNLGMRTAVVESGSSSSTLEATGSVVVDERRIVAIEARAAGWVERLDVHAVGETVRRGQAVAAIYAPDLLAGQEELALARKIGDPAMVDAARSRLSLLGVTESSKGAQRRVAITTPQDGVVTDLMVRQGAQVTPGTPLMKIADLSTVWVLVEVPETQSSAIKSGDDAKAEFSAVPNRVFTGRVEYLYPTLDSQTRTLRARLVFDNADGALRPGMYGRVNLGSGTASSAMLVPTEAVIRTGTRSVVLVAEGEGRYRPVEVTLGAESRDRIVILSGLSAGQRVVTSGQFLIDSEASLLGSYDRMGTTP